ncbi:MAG: ATP-binding protein [Mucispirillum sp.]|nr:ATP-binding protein [Mucispirillum sp.]
MNTQILVPSAPILVESTRSIGYSFETAVADIIDNSISKHANNIFIYFDSNNPQYLMVLDNGAGMDNNELIDAMKYGSKSSNDERDKDDLGRFGLGLKMASLSQCRKLTVVSKKGSKLSGAVWDLDHIIETNNWELILLDDNDIKQVKYIDKLNSYESGTIVLWENFDRITKEAGDHSKIFDNKITITRAHVSLVFHRFLSENNKFLFFSIMN